MKSLRSQPKLLPPMRFSLGSQAAVGSRAASFAASFVVAACGGGDSGGAANGGAANGGSAGAPAGNGAPGAAAGAPMMPAPPSVPNMQLTRLASGVTEPLYVAQPPGEEQDLYVVEKGGRILILTESGFSSTPFLDVTARTLNSGERGLLGLAFHPQFETNGLFYVHYSLGEGVMAGAEDGTGVISEFSVSGDNRRLADPGTERVLLTLEQPDVRHNGGCLQFGPDGMLYIATGDGGLRNDREGPDGRRELGYGQSLNTMLGKILRIDVNGRGTGGAYDIPAGNMASPALPEIWSYGLRNPWRFSFDRESGHMYLGDVGESLLEEVNFQPAGTSGYNFGWRFMEGDKCFDSPAQGAEGCVDAFVRIDGVCVEPPGELCLEDGMYMPVATYEHDLIQGGFSITGGYVYRGSALPGLVGKYIYTDFVSGNFWALDTSNAPEFPSPELITAAIPPPEGSMEGEAFYTSFGEDNAGELYLVSFDGSVYRLDPRP